MALQLWMPLMGDLHNQGLSDYSISTLGTLSWVSGKLGAQAVKVGDGTQVVNGIRIEDNFTELLNGDYSVSVWVKPYGQHIHYNGSIFSSGNWNTANKRWAFGVNQNNTKVDVLCNNYNTYLDCSVPVNEWTHLVCTCGSDRIIKLYKNGEYIGAVNREDNVFDSDYTWSAIGRESYANGYFSFNGAIQDFRLYNHCLSPMGVKELSQGLVLHYPLNRQGLGQENLATQYVVPGTNGPLVTTSNGRTIYYGKYGIIIPATENADTYFSIYLKQALESGKTYTLSCKVSGLLSGTYYNFPLFAQGNSSMGLLKLNHNGLCSLTFTMNYTGTVATSTVNGVTLYRLFMDDYSRTIASGQGAITITNIKLEEGEKATQWCPNSIDTLYTTMGLNSNIEYDTSGYCNNGTRTGTFNWTSDTPKYVVSTTAAGGASTYLVGPILPAEAKTAALWIKCKKSQNAAIFNDKTSGLQIGLLNSILYMNSKTSTPGFTTTHWVDDKWNHVVVTYDGSTRKAYINGQPETQSGASNYYRHNADNCWLWNRSYNNNYSFNGSLSDFRIYATALSAADVKSLYEANNHEV